MRKRWPRVLAAIAILFVVMAFLVVGCEEIHSLHARHWCGSRSVRKLSKACTNTSRTVHKHSPAPCFGYIPGGLTRSQSDCQSLISRTPRKKECF